MAERGLRRWTKDLLLGNIIRPRETGQAERRGASGAAGFLANSVSGTCMSQFHFGRALFPPPRMPPSSFGPAKLSGSKRNCQ
jgi:hypothetical protein